MVAVATMSLRGYTSPGKPGSAEEAAWKRKHLVKAMAVPVVKTLWVHRATVESFNALNMVLQANGAHLGEKVDDWGWANRLIRGSDPADINWSLHRWALAEDLDATENIQHSNETTFPRKVTHEACDLLKLEWGLDFNAPWKDPMHFQDQLFRLRRRWIASRLRKPTRRSRRLAKLADLPVDVFCRRVNHFERFPS